MMPFKKQKIGRNDICPCGSKKKFKYCHGGVNAVATPTPGQVDAQLRNLAPKAKCLAPDCMRNECQGRVIASHTVSRSGSLGAIAKNGHVFSYAASIQLFEKLEGGIEPKLTGWKEASTFPLFCSFHDKSLFSPLEDKPFIGSRQQCFLLSYRANVWEYYAKLRSSQKNKYRLAIASQKNEILQNFVAVFNQQTDLGLRDTIVRKEKFDDILVNKRWAECHGLLIEFDRVFPIQCSAAWSPTMDVQGEALQILDYKPRTPQGATIASFAADGRSYFLLSWLDDSATVASKLADSIDKVPDSEKAGVIAALLLLTSENCHLSPDWYDSLPPSGKDAINSLAHPVLNSLTAPAIAGRSTFVSNIGIKTSAIF